MQCNLFFYIFVSYSLFLWKQWSNSLMTSEIQIVCFPSFVLTVFWGSTSYTKKIVLWKMLMESVDALSCWWPCACLKYVSGLRRLEKTLNFLRCIHVVDLVLKYVSDIYEENRLQLLLYFLVFMGIVTAVIGNRFFSAVFQVLDWSFLVLHFDGNVCNWIPKLIWSRMDWFWGFLLGTGFFRRLHICIDLNVQELLNCCSFWGHQFFSMFRLRVILVCSLKMF